MISIMTYAAAKEKVLQLIEAPPPELPEESFKTAKHVLNSFGDEYEIDVPSVKLNLWNYFNSFTGGFRPNEFSILCGPTGVGKTTLLANMALEFMAVDAGVFIGSVEIGANDFMGKMVSAIMDKDLLGERVSVDEIKKNCGRFLSKSDTVFSNYDSRVNPLQLMCDLYYAYVTKGVKVALIDNLNFLMDVVDAKNQITEMDKTVHQFIVFCKKVPIHVIMVMHPRKTTDGRVESEFDIKGSSTAVQEASNVFLFNRVKQEDAEFLPIGITPQFAREIKFAKVRKRGRSTGSRVFFEIQGKGERYSEVSYK